MSIEERMVVWSVFLFPVVLVVLATVGFLLIRRRNKSKPAKIVGRPTVQDVAEKLSELENPRKSIWRNLLVPALSLVLFISLGLLVNPLFDLVILILVIFIHELGHFAAMTAFGYRDVRMFFIPLFGGAVSGRAADISTTKKAIVYLAGPLPGILLGWLVAIAGIFLNLEALIQAATLFIVINGFNLVPVFPLDGGRLVNDVVFSRNKYVETGFNILAAIVLIVGAILLRDFFIGILGFLLLITIRYRSQIRSLSEKLKAAQEFEPQFSLLEAPQEVIELVVRSVIEEFQQLKKPGPLANAASTLWSQLLTSPPSALRSVLIISVYLFAWAITLVPFLIIGLL